MNPGATPWRAGAHQDTGDNQPQWHPRLIRPGSAHAHPKPPSAGIAGVRGPQVSGSPGGPAPSLLSPRPHTLLLRHGPSPQLYGDSRRKKPGKEASTPGSADFGRGGRGCTELVAGPEVRGLCGQLHSTRGATSPPPAKGEAGPQRWRGPVIAPHTLWDAGAPSGLPGPAGTGCEPIFRPGSQVLRALSSPGPVSPSQSP